MAPPLEKDASLYNNPPDTPSHKSGHPHFLSHPDVLLETKKHNHSKTHGPAGFCRRLLDFDSLSRRSQLIIVMLAIPVLLTAWAVLSRAHPLNLNFLPNVIRAAFPAATPAPLPKPTAAPGVAPPLVDNSLSSVLGPLTQTNFPDPGIFIHEGTAYAFGTNNKGLSEYGMIHIQVATSKDNVTWTIKEGWDALPTVGKWETGHRVWAPDVVQVGDGTFVMYYADDTTWAPDKHCVGVATSKSVLGPYTPQDKPFACPNVHTKGGAIDPDGYLDPSTGRRYVTYKVDGNSIGHGGLCNNAVPPIVPTPIMLQEVSAENGIDHIGNPIQILDRDQLDGPLIEAPSLIRSDQGIYFLFYSSSCFTTPMYDVSYATATDIRGPYIKSRRPLIYTGAGGEALGLVGPGGFDIWLDGKVGLFHGHLTSANQGGDVSEVDLASHGQGGDNGAEKIQQRAKDGKKTDPKSKSKTHNDPPPVSPLVRCFYSTWNITMVKHDVWLNATKIGA